MGVKLKLSERTLQKAQEFLRKVREYSPLTDEPQFQSRATVFVCIPMRRELENAERLFSSYYRQTPQKGSRAEIVFLVNNRAGDTCDIIQENEKTYRLLTSLSHRFRRGDIGFHPVDCFSRGHSLSPNLPFGAIRNIANAFVVAHSLKHRKNSLILSTDADTFAEKGLLEELRRTFLKRGSVFGSVGSGIEYHEDLCREDQEKIKLLFLLSAVQDVLVNYLSEGIWSMPSPFGGCNTFYSVDTFLEVGGYNHKEHIPEDFDLAGRLMAALPDRNSRIDQELLTNTVRMSNRLLGDGMLLEEAKERGFRTPLSATFAVQHATLRKWLFACLKEKIPFRKGELLLCKLDLPIRMEGLSNLRSTEEHNDEERYLILYEKMLRLIQDANSHLLADAEGSFQDLVLSLLGGNREFQALVDRVSCKLGRQTATLNALLIFAEKKTTGQK